MYKIVAYLEYIGPLYFYSTCFEKYKLIKTITLLLWPFPSLEYTTCRTQELSSTGIYYLPDLGTLLPWNILPAGLRNSPPLEYTTCRTNSNTGIRDTLLRNVLYYFIKRSFIPTIKSLLELLNGDDQQGNKDKVPNTFFKSLSVKRHFVIS